MKESEPFRIFNGLAGSPAIAILSVREGPNKTFLSRTELLDGPTEPGVLIACNKRVAELEADPTVVRIIVAPIASERRRGTGKIPERVVLPFKRVNGKH